MAFSFASLFGGGGNIPSKDGVVGIDIGSSSIKVVQIKLVKGVPTLETYGELQLGPYQNVDVGMPTQLTSEKVTQALIDILREAGVQATGATFSLSHNLTFTATVPIATTDIQKIPAILPVEARKYVPIALSKVALDWSLVSVNEGEGVTHVFISAIPNESLGRYEAIMQGSGLASRASEIEIFSAIRSSLVPEDEHVALFDCGASATHLTIVRKGAVVKTHSILLSGSELTKIFKDAASVDFNKAEEEKHLRGILSDGEDATTPQKALIRELERGFREMHTVIKRHEESEGTEVASVILTGGGALLPGLTQYLGDMFSKPVRIADPFAKVAYPVFLEDTLKQAGPLFSVSIGSALRALTQQK